MNSIREYFANDIRRRCLCVSALEREAEMPKKTLEHFLNGRRGLSEKYAERLKSKLKHLGYED